MSSKNNKYTYSLGLEIIILVIVSTLLSIFSYYIRTPDRFLRIVSLWMENPFSLILNTIPILLFSLIVLGITGRLNISVIITTVLSFAISYINAQKILIREEPLVIADITLLREAVNIMTEMDWGDIITTLIKYLILMTVILVFTNALLKQFRLTGKNRLMMTVISIGVFLIMIPTIYSSKAIYDSFPRLQEVETNIAQSYTDKGLFYCLIYNRDTHSIKAPDNYNTAYVEEIKKDFKYTKPESLPHVVMVMGEAWTDISESDETLFKEGLDPYKHASETIEESIYSGHIYTRSYGGGTANTEYDALTGRSSELHSDSVFTSYSAVRGDISSIVEIFNDHGYETLAIHPGKDWFYNREKVYKYMGFDQSYFDKDFTSPLIKGGYISEESLTSFMIDKFEDRLNTNNPVFEFAVTIQNHSPFNYEKYDVDLNTFDSESIKGEDKEILESYFVGVRDMDYQIKELKEYFNSIDEPVVFIYFGDHQPYLNNDYDLLIKLGLPIVTGAETGSNNIEAAHKVPFFVWGNDAYMKPGHKKHEDLYINSFQLSEIVLRCAQLGDVDPFYQYLGSLRDTLPVITTFFSYVDENGDLQRYNNSDLPETYLEELNKYKSLNYYYSK